MGVSYFLQQYMQEGVEQQLFFMRWAIQLGEKGRCTAPPNPWVGCVIVKNGTILGEGFHEAAGKKHAEIMALEKAGALAQGATAYISLEPCPHQGRTPPCTQALIRAGIKRVVIPFFDPDPHVSGQGAALIEEAGIEVILGLGAEEAKRSLAPYLFQRHHKRPFCVLKCALSLDGRLAASDGSSQWITGEEARRDAHLLRAQSQAILIGANTAVQDLPRLTVRTGPVSKQPLRVVLDPQGKVPPSGPLADPNLAPTLIFTSKSHHKIAWEQSGAEVVLKEEIALIDLLKELGEREVIQLLVEGGSQLHRSFLQEHLANRLVLYFGNCLLGDQGKPFLSNFFIPEINQAPRLNLENVQRFAQDVRLDFLAGD